MTCTASSLPYLRTDLHRIGPIFRSVGFMLDKLFRPSCSTVRFLWLAKVKPLPSSRNGCLRLCPRHNRRSKPPKTKWSGPNGTSRLFSRSLTSKTNATPASGPPSAPRSRPSSAPPPAKLTPDLSLREFRAWRATWTNVFELSDGQRPSLDRQLALFRTCLSSEMRAALGHPIPTKTTLNEQLDEIAEHFRRQRNIALYRVQFEQRQQQAGESFDNFYVSIRELATDAELALCLVCVLRKFAKSYLH